LFLFWEDQVVHPAKSGAKKEKDKTAAGLQIGGGWQLRPKSRAATHVAPCLAYTHGRNLLLQLFTVITNK